MTSNLRLQPLIAEERCGITHALLCAPVPVPMRLVTAGCNFESARWERPTKSINVRRGVTMGANPRYSAPLNFSTWSLLFSKRCPAHISVGTRGLQLRAPDWALLPDLNCERQTSMGIAGPQCLDPIAPLSRALQSA